MSEDGKRVEVRMGTFACTIEGYDDPIIKLREVMTLVQQMVTETPALVDLSVDVDNAEVQKALDARTDPVVVRRADAGEGSGEGEPVAEAPEPPDTADEAGATTDVEAAEVEAPDEAAPDEAASAPAGEFPDAGRTEDGADERATGGEVSAAGDIGPDVIDADIVDTMAARTEIEDAEVVAFTPAAEVLEPAEAVPDAAAEEPDTADVSSPEEDADAVVELAPDGDDVPDAPAARDDADDDARSAAAPAGGPVPAARVDTNRTGHRLYGLGRFAAGVDGARRRRGPEAPPPAAPEAAPSDTVPQADGAVATGAPDVDRAPDADEEGGQPMEVNAAGGDAVTAGTPADVPTPDAAPDADERPDEDAAAEKRAAVSAAMFYLRSDRGEPEEAPGRPGDEAPAVTAEGDDADLGYRLAGDEIDTATEAAAEPFAPTPVDTSERTGPSASFRNIFSARSEPARDEAEEAGPVDIFAARPDPAAETPDIWPTDIPQVHETPLKSPDALAPAGPTPPLGQIEAGTIRFRSEPANIFGEEPGAAADRGATDTDAPVGEPEDPDGDVMNIFAADPAPAPAVGGREPAGETAAPERTDSRFSALMQRLKSGGEPEGSRPVATSSDPSAAGGPADPRATRFSASDFAKIAAAETVPDLLIASAAWLTMAQGRAKFSRGEVMDVFDTLPGDHPRTLEARIKGYGKLVRSGSLILVGEGQFALAQTEREWFAGLLP